MIALVRCADVERFARAAGSPLSDWERETAERIPHPRRRTEFVAGRMAAKWLVVRHEYSDMMSRIAWPPRVHLIGARELGTSAAERYRRVDVRRDSDGAPYLAGDDRSPTHVSIAHRGGWAVAALSVTGAIGIDLEQISPRRPEFYDANMTARERRWIFDAPAEEADRAGTLVWALKEACLKTGASMARTVWEIGAIDVDIELPARFILDSWPSIGARAGSTLRSLPMRVPLARAGDSMHAAYGAVGDLVVGVVALTAQADLIPLGEFS